jgi:hypothetical protein
VLDVHHETPHSSVIKPQTIASVHPPTVIGPELPVAVKPDTGHPTEDKNGIQETPHRDHWRRRGIVAGIGGYV